MLDAGTDGPVPPGRVYRQGEGPLTGFVFLAAIAAWVALSALITRALLQRLPSIKLRPFVGTIVFVSLMVLPIIDEIIGGIQFKALCSRNAVFRVMVVDPQGRTTKVTAQPSAEVIPGVPIKIIHSRVIYTDVTTGETVVEFDRYSARGGILIRLLGISEGNKPLTFESGCSPETEKGEVVSRTLKFSVVN